VIEKEPQWIRDIVPSMFYTFFIIFAHILYMYTQNAMGLMCIMLCYNLFSTPYFGLRKDYPLDNYNLSKNTEKTFMNDTRFDIPLQSFVFVETLCWIWGLIVCSDKVNTNILWLNPDISTTSKYISFTFLWGFFTGLGAICGHELTHKKGPMNKAIGTWAFTKFFYTHFLDDHMAGHHKYIGTP